jgi:hypothetical protein
LDEEIDEQMMERKITNLKKKLYLTKQ